MKIVTVPLAFHPNLPPKAWPGVCYQEASLLQEQSCSGLEMLAKGWD